LVLPQNNFELNTPKDFKKECFSVEETFLMQTQGQTEALVRKIGKNDSYTYNNEVRIYQNKERI
jgi:hypothetical protein